MPTSTSSLIPQSNSLQLDTRLIEDENRYDIFISYDGEEKLQRIQSQGNGMTTRDFVEKYLVPSIRYIWRSRKYEGEAAIFYDDSIKGKRENAIFGSIKTLQVVYTGFTMYIEHINCLQEMMIVVERILNPMLVYICHWSAIMA